MRVLFEPGEFAALVVRALEEPAVRAALHQAVSVPAVSDHLTVEEFAARWRVSRRTVAGWLVAGMPAVRVGRVVRVGIVAGDEWVRGRGSRPCPPRESSL